MNIESGINKIEQKERFNPNFEIGNFADVESSIIFYTVSKTIDNSWGNEQDEKIAKEIREQNIHLDKDLVDLYNKIRELTDENDETLRWLAFAVEKDDEMQSFIIDQMIKYKGFDKEDVKELFSKFNNFYRKAKQSFDLAETRKFVATNIDQRSERFSELKKKINEAINFFNPQSSEIKKVVYLPTNPLEKKQSGSGIEVGKTFYINAENGNEVNEIHEFLHSIINPIIEKIELSEDEGKVILDLCPDKLKSYQYPLSILTEEIIRTYHTGFQPDNKPSLENFKKRLLSLSKIDLQKMLDQEQKQGVAMAGNVEELLSSEEVVDKYYNKYSRDILAEKIWNLFEDYQSSSAGNFERFFIDNYRKIFN
ncbi:MAG: hypothetical protein WCK37_00805 [Candidatus Falkowbacteria bacterium]